MRARDGEAGSRVHGGEAVVAGNDDAMIPPLRDQLLLRSSAGGMAEVADDDGRNGDAMEAVAGEVAVEVGAGPDDDDDGGETGYRRFHP